MELTTIRLKDFLSHRDTILTFGTKIQIVHGANGAGKSSLIDAIAYVLLGEPLRAELLKKEHGELIRHGAKEATVELSLPGLHIVRTITATTRTLTLERNGEPVVGGQDALQQVVYDALGTSAQALRTAIDSERFLHLSPAERKSLLFGLAKEPFTAVTIAERLRRALGSGDSDLPVGGVAELAAAQGFPAAEKHAVEQRRQAKRDADAQEDVLSHLPPAMFATAAGKTISLENVKPEAVAEQVAKLEDERDALVEARGARAQAEPEDVEALEKRAEEMAVRSCVLRGEQAGLKGGRLADEIPALMRERDAAAHALDLARRSLAEAQAELKATPADPEPQAEGCAACGRAYDADALAEAKKRHAGVLQGLSDRRERWGLAVKMAQSTLAEAEQLCGSAQEALDLTEKGTGRAKEIERELALLAEEKPRLGERIAAARKALAAARAEDPTPKIERLDARIAEGRRMVRAVEDYLAGRERSAAAKAVIKGALARAELYDALQKALSSSGIPADIARETMGPVRERIDEAGKKLGLAVELTDDCEVLIEGRDARLASKSERLRAGILVQHAVCQAAGLRLLLLDLDVTLDPEMKKLVNATVAGIAGAYDRVIILLTITAEGVRASRGQITNWIISGGDVEMVEREAA